MTSLSYARMALPVESPRTQGGTYVALTSFSTLFEINEIGTGLSTCDDSLFTKHCDRSLAYSSLYYWKRQEYWAGEELAKVSRPKFLSGFQ
jgi:hypothetical protein